QDATTLATSHVSPGGGPRATIAVVEGAAPSVRVLEPGGALTIGRSRSCDWSFADNLASRVQAIVTFDPALGLLVEDPGSRNGTFLDDERLRERQVWSPGQVVRFGNVRLMATVTGTRTDGSHEPGDDEQAGVIVSSPLM